jgi:hypothetical protein
MGMGFKRVDPEGVGLGHGRGGDDGDGETEYPEFFHILILSDRIQQVENAIDIRTIFDLKQS